MSTLIRNYMPADQASVDQLVRDAWSELATLMPGWPELAPRLQALTANADASDVIVVELDGQLVGAVGYGHTNPSQTSFRPIGPSCGSCPWHRKREGMVWGGRCFKHAWPEPGVINAH